MNVPHVLTSSKPRLILLSLLALSGVAIISFAIGADASAQTSGGISVGGSGSAGAGSGSTEGDAAANGYARIWTGIPSREKRWARSTSQCESGGDPDAIGGGGSYRGAFQFLRSTWKASPKSPGGDPIDFDYRTQAVVAVLLKQRDGANHWPVCG